MEDTFESGFLDELQETGTPEMEDGPEHEEQYQTEKIDLEIPSSEVMETEEEEQPTIEPEPPDDVKELYADYPEYERAIEFQLQKRLGGADLAALQHQIGFMSWQNDVTNGVYDEQGAFIEGHPDFLKITADSNKEYWTWYKSKGYGPCDSRTAIKRISEYKASRATSRQKVTKDDFSSAFNED